MAQTSTSYSRRWLAVAGSSGFFRAIVGLFVLQAAWIALSGRYPMAFDEDFHLGIIRLYAHHPWPFWAGQPVQADMFGAVARDPSYLYHFLMSFPYRLIEVFTSNQTIQVLILRAVNIGMFTGGIVLCRRLLLKTGASRALVHLCLLAFVLLPVAPLLAAQINYDNLLLPLVAVALLLTVRFDALLTKQKKFATKTLLQLLIVCLLASLVKYAFLPLFMTMLGFGIVRVWQHYRSVGKTWSGLVAGWWQMERQLQVVLVVCLLVASGLFIERYGVNTVRYHTPVPDCDQVLTVKQCSQYGPWIRDYHYEQSNTGGSHSPLTFTGDWLDGMWLRTFFAVDGPATSFQTRVPLFIPGVSAIVLGILSGLAVVATAPRLFKRYNAPVLYLFFAATAVYVAVLWLDVYRAFVRTGQPVAINGRYLLLVFPLVFLAAGMALNELLRKRLAAKVVTATVIIGCLAWGGGALTYILRSNDAWYWPSPVVRTANHAVQRTLGPVTPGYTHGIRFLQN